MSAAIKASTVNAGRVSGGALMSRSAFMGDPGLFGFIGKAISSVGGAILGSSPLGGLARTAVTAATGFFGGRASAGATAPFIPTAIRPPIIARSLFVQEANGSKAGGGTPAGAPVAGATGARQRFFPTGATGLGEGCQSGFHPNKSDYFLKDGTFVEAGSRCVKNRRRNPLNPRANSRAIKRLQSAKRADKLIRSVTIRCPRCAKNSDTCGCR